MKLNNRRRLLVTGVWPAALLVVAAALAGQEVDGPQPAPEPGSELTVSLVTFGPGDVFWESFGHNGIWVENRSVGRGILYHWGLFDFTEPGFLPRFLKGEMIYSMGASDPERTFRAYESANRSITVQELNLTPAQRLTLYRLAQENLEDPRYRYDIFLDNCSTRVRDLIDRVTDGALEAQTADQPGEDYWYHVARLTQHRPEVLVGMEIFLGNGGSRPISRWDAGFTPLLLDDALRDATLTRGGSVEPFVLAEYDMYESTRPREPESPTTFVWIVAVLGLTAALVIAGAAHLAARGNWFGRLGFAALGGGWSFLAGLLGFILVSGFFTDHHWMFWNENLFQFTLFSLPLAVLVPLAALRGERGVWVSRLALIAAALSLVGCALQVLPGLDQRNGELLSLTLPLHLALSWGLARLPIRPDNLARQSHRSRAA